MSKKNHRSPQKPSELIVGRGHGTYRTQAISQADSRLEKSNVACPNDENVERARHWVNENHK